MLFYYIIIILILQRSQINKHSKHLIIFLISTSIYKKFPHLGRKIMVTLPMFS